MSFDDIIVIIIIIIIWMPDKTSHVVGRGTSGEGIIPQCRDLFDIGTSLGS